MLVLTVKVYDEIWIDDRIKIVFKRLTPKNISVAIEAPKNVNILRIKGNPFESDVKDDDKQDS